MSQDQLTCWHKDLYFGSGDFYIFCYDCGRSWVHRNLINDTSSYEHSQLPFGSHIHRLDMNDNLKILERKYNEREEK